MHFRLTDRMRAWPARFLPEGRILKKLSRVVINILTVIKIERDAHCRKKWDCPRDGAYFWNGNVLQMGEGRNA